MILPAKTRERPSSTLLVTDCARNAQSYAGDNKHFTENPGEGWNTNRRIVLIKLRHLLPCAGSLLAVCLTPLSAQTDGTVQLNATITDYPGNGDDHWTVVWVTTDSGTFIKTLWKQGPSSMTSSHWNKHCRVWYEAKNNTANGGNNVVDGYTSGSAKNYTSTSNNPIDPEWDCRDKNNNLVPDGNYKFWIQYAEDDGQGPSTSSGLRWTKGPASATSNYPNQGANFINMSVTWAPDLVAPVITSAKPPAQATVGAPYDYTCTCTGSTPITFAATGLPTGLTMGSDGHLTGTPEETGVFTGTITASNGATPDASQAFTIVVDLVPVHITSVTFLGGDFSLEGTGPANGAYTVLAATDPSTPLAAWGEIRTGSFNATGQCAVTIPIPTGPPEIFFRLRVP